MDEKKEYLEAKKYYEETKVEVEKYIDRQLELANLDYESISMDGLIGLKISASKKFGLADSKKCLEEKTGELIIWGVKKVSESIGQESDDADMLELYPGLVEAFLKIK